MTELYNCFLEKRYPEEWDMDWKENTHYSLGLFLVQYLGNGFNLADAQTPIDRRKRVAMENQSTF